MAVSAHVQQQSGQKWLNMSSSSQKITSYTNKKPGTENLNTGSNFSADVEIREFAYMLNY